MMPRNPFVIITALFIIVLVLKIQESVAQPVSDKRGGICIRIDDNQPIEKLRQVDSVFSKYGLNFCMSMSCGDFEGDIPYVDYLKLLLSKGHELMDHSPSHQTQYFDLFNLQDTSLYSGVPGVNHLSGNRVCLNYSGVDTSTSHNEGIVSIQGNFVVSKLPGEFNDIGEFIGLYFHKLDQVFIWSELRAVDSNDPDTLVIRSFWDEEISLGNYSDITYHKLTRNDVTMSPEGIQLLGKRTLKIFTDLNIPRPYSWIHPGGRMPYIPAEEVKLNIGDEVQFKDAACYEYPTYLCFNEYNPDGIKQFSMQYGEISIERNTFKWNKNLISDFIAKHFVQIDLLHLSDPLGGMPSLLKRLDSLLNWCSVKNIPVKTQLKWKANLYDYTPNGAVNAIPALNIDLNEDQYPDGYSKNPIFKSIYSTKDGVQESGGCSFEISQNGKMCWISKLAGLEKGKNYFSIWTKGTNQVKGTVKVQFTFPENGGSKILLIPADSSAWIKYSDSLFIPDSISQMDMTIENLTQDPSVIKISGISLKTTGPLIVDFFSDKVCNGDTTTLTSFSSPMDSIQYLKWDLNGDGNFEDAEGMIVKHRFGGSGIYNVGLKGITFSGKSKAIYNDVIVSGVKVDFNQSNGCAGLESAFTDKSVLIGDYPSAYFWNFGDGTPSSSEVNPTHIYTDQGLFQVKHRVTTSAGCTDSLIKIIIIESPPILDLTFSGDTVFSEGDSVIAMVYGDYNNILWSDGSTQNSLVIKTTGKWWVKGFKNKCFSEESFSTLRQEYGLEPVVMTVITPNGDGFNDAWKILNLSKIGPCEVEIYDRWGIKVFSSREYDNSWDGIYNGKSLGNDTYYYFIHTTDGHLYKGTLSIVK